MGILFKINMRLLWCTGYSGSDLQALCEEAAMMPIRELGENILTIKANQVMCVEIGCNLIFIEVNLLYILFWLPNIAKWIPLI